MTSVLFVCYGNICRSPALQAALEWELAERGITDWHVDSCGLSASFAGAPIDARMVQALQGNGITANHTARPFSAADYTIFEHIFPISNELVATLKAEAPKSAREKIALVTTYATEGRGLPIPDPYTDTQRGFEMVVTTARSCARGIVAAFTK